MQAGSEPGSGAVVLDTRSWQADLRGTVLTLLAVLVADPLTPEAAGRVHIGWIIGALLIAVLCRIPTPRWWPYLLVSLGGNWIVISEAGWTGSSRLLLAAVDVLCIAGAARILQRLRAADFRSAKTIWVLAAVGGSAAALRGVTLTSADFIQPQLGERLVEVIAVTVAGTMLSIFTITPFILLVALEWPLSRPDAAWVRRVLPPLALTLASMAFTYSTASEGVRGAEFVPVPFVVLSILRMRRAEAAALLSLAMGWVVVSTSHGLGPFATGDTAATTRLDQLTAAVGFCMAATFVCWFIITQRSAAAAAENELRATFDLAATPLEVETFAGARLRANRATLEFFEMTAEQLDSYHWTELSHPDDIAEDQRLLAELQDGRLDQYRLLKRYRLPSGKQKWGSLSVTRATDPASGEDFLVTQIVDVTAEKQALERLDYELDHDAVTGLLSRRGIASVLEDMMQEAREQQSHVAALLIDLSEFVFINKSLGHAAADEAMQNLATAVRAAVPTSARIGRFDGFLLLVVLPSAAEAPDFEAWCSPILAAVASEQTLRGHRIVREATIGASLSTATSTAATLLREADVALSQERPDDQRWSLYAGEGDGSAVADLAIEHELRVALDRDELEVFLQPQVRLSSGAIVGHEALVRWRHPERGLLGPGAFLAEAERAGLMAAIGQQVLASVCAMLRERDDLDGHVSVNVSPLELTSRGWIDRFEETVRAAGVPFDRLVIEFTETAAMRLSVQIIDGLRSLRALGVGIHVDDFGTGYSSIALLRELPVSGLKLDRSFVDDLANPDGSAVALATGLAGLAKGLDLETIAEGIETREQAALLRGIGWEIGQGYLFGRPAPFDSSNFAI